MFEFPQILEVLQKAVLSH